MASAVATQHLRANASIAVYDHDPDSGSATITTPDAGTTKRFFDMRDFGKFAVCVAFTTGTAITKVEIIASDDSSGSNVVAVKDSGSITLNALGEFNIQECSAEEIAQLATAGGIKYRYVAARITASMADEALVTYIGFEPSHSYLDVTAANNTL